MMENDVITQILLSIIAFFNGGALILLGYFVKRNDADHKEIFSRLWDLKNGKK